MEELTRTVEKVCGVAIALLIVIPIFQHVLKIHAISLFESFGIDMLKSSVS